MANKLVFLVAVVGLALPSIADAQCPVPGFQYAAFGDQGVDITGNGTIRGYDSSAGTTPACGTDADLGTNSTAGGALKVTGGSVVCGETSVGNGGTPGTVVQLGGGSTIAGSGTCGATNCTAQTTNTPMTPVVLPTGLTANLTPLSGNQTLVPGTEYGTISTANGNTLTIPAGTYLIDRLSMANGSVLAISSGPVVIFIRNQLDVAGTLTNPSLKATDLVFFGANTLTTVTINSAGTQTSFGLYAPNADITLNGNAEFYGAMVGKSVRVNGNAILNYDRALSNFASTAITCSNTEVSRATPIAAKVTNSLQEAIVQGTVNMSSGAPTTILTTGDVANWVFPHQSGHVRARLATSITSTASDFSAGTILLDAGVGIPQVVNSGCTLGTNNSFRAACRNVFTNTNSDPSATGETTTQIRRDPSTLVMFNDSNADAIGALIAPAGAVSGIGSAHWQTIVRKVLRGSSTSTISRLGGVDRSTVAVIGPSTFAGSGTRPTMIYFGGTDGMLHAVCASTGGTTASQSNICPTTLPDGTSPPAGQIPATELWAFAPRVQLPLMRFNTARIDGSVRVTDVFGDFTSGTGNGTKSWHTILTFQTGYSDTNTKPAVYALDVTDPAKPILLWEYVPPTTSKSQFELGIGLAMHAGASLISNVITNIAVAQTNNGGTGANGFVAQAIQLETGATKWKFGYEYPNTPGPRGVAADVNTMCPSPAPAPFVGLCTRVPGGAVGVDLIGTGFTSDIVMGDLYGNLWRLKASDGTSVTGATTPIFSFTTNRHPIGSVPAILNNGNKVAVFGSGGYVDVDPLGTLWSDTQQHLIGVKLDGPTALTTLNEGSGSSLAFKADLSSGEKVLGQVLVVGTTIFITSDTANFNATGYGTGSATGSLSSYNFGAPTPSLSLVSAIQSGAGSATSGAGVFANGGGNTATYVGGGTKQQAGATAAIAGANVDYMNTTKTSRVAWLNTKF